jgi:membrane protease YdiL (CAAX protease family)
MIILAAFLITVAGGIGFFVLGLTLEVSVALLLVALLLRLASSTRKLGRFVEVLALFALVSFALGELGIHYPYSYILILSAMLPVVLMEGSWSEVLFFMPGLTGRFTKQAVTLALLASLGLALYLWLRSPAPADNPVPAGWPVDALVILGLGFSVYVALFEETIFRSILFARAEAATGTTSAIFLQAVFYGFLHYRSGMPNGWEGVGSMFALGLGLGWLVRLSRSIYLSMMVRFITVFVVFLTLVWLSR